MKMVMDVLLCIIIIFVNKFPINGFPISEDIPPTQNKPYENRELFEGDILFPGLSSLTARGVALRGTGVTWTNGIVPYEIRPGYATTQEAFIISTMQKMERLISINNVACIQFRPKISSDPYFITIINGVGCSSYVGQNTGVSMTRTVTLQYPGCIDEGRIMHELLHTLGFYHEQSRPDRDNYVTINYANIQSGTEHNFDKYNNSYVDTLNTSYDYSSVMHYENNAFSSNGLPTIVPLQANVSIGQRYNMSSIDIQEVRILYNCLSSGVTLSPIPTTTTVNLFVINTTLSSTWASTDPKYGRYNGSGLNYYYHAYLVSVPVAGYYVLTSNSSIDTFGYIYSSTFYPSYSYYNLIAYDDDSGGNRQFKITMNFPASVTYILIVTSYNQYATGSYTVIASGLNRVNLVRVSTSSVIRNSGITTMYSIEMIYVVTVINVFIQIII